MSVYLLAEPLAPTVLDTLLALGYYRMRQTVFTTRYTIADGDLPIEVLWIRIVLDHYKPGKRHKELIRRCRHFTLRLQNAVITPEIETLYAIYAASVDFEAPGSVTEFLLGDSKENFFPSRMWQVHDGDLLIGVGYFDEGSDSCAGILNFYDPAYSKFSLSKWMYFEGVSYAAGTGKKYFYPGYIALDFPKFDYKLEAGKKHAEVWEPDAHLWIPYADSMHARQQ